MIQILKVYIPTEESRIFTAKCLTVVEILSNFNVILTLFFISNSYYFLYIITFYQILSGIGEDQ